MHGWRRCAWRRPCNSGGGGSISQTLAGVRPWRCSPLDALGQAWGDWVGRAQARAGSGRPVGRGDRHGVGARALPAAYGAGVSCALTGASKPTGSWSCSCSSAVASSVSRRSACAGSRTRISLGGARSSAFSPTGSLDPTATSRGVLRGAPEAGGSSLRPFRSRCQLRGMVPGWCRSVPGGRLGARLVLPRVRPWSRLLSRD